MKAKQQTKTSQSPKKDIIAGNPTKNSIRPTDNACGQMTPEYPAGKDKMQITGKDMNEVYRKINIIRKGK